MKSRPFQLPLDSKYRTHVSFIAKDRTTASAIVEALFSLSAEFHFDHWNEAEKYCIVTQNKNPVIKYVEERITEGCYAKTFGDGWD